jgi:hypothetical protein
LPGFQFQGGTKNFYEFFLTIRRPHAPREKLCWPDRVSPKIENTLAKMPHVATQGRPGIAMVTLS